jgi:hypothetical protein
MPQTYCKRNSKKLNKINNLRDPRKTEEKAPREGLFLGYGRGRGGGENRRESLYF